MHRPSVRSILANVMKKKLLCMGVAIVLLSQAGFGQEVDQSAELKSELSALWTVVMVNMVYADVLALYLPGTHEEMIDFLGSEEAIPKAMFAAALMIQVPTSMIFLSKRLNDPVNRWVNMAAAAFTAAGQNISLSMDTQSSPSIGLRYSLKF